MLTTTPRLSPCVADTPSPATRSSPLGSTSATTAITLAVPMSNPTTRSLYSLAMTSLVLFLGFGDHGRDALQPDRISVVVSQVRVFERALVALRHLRERGKESLGAREHFVVRSPPEFHFSPHVHFGTPRSAARQRQAVDARIDAIEEWLQAA